MNELDKKKCLPCEGGLDPLSKDKCLSFLEKLDKGWSLNADVKSIERTFTCKNHHHVSTLRYQHGTSSQNCDKTLHTLWTKQHSLAQSLVTTLDYKYGYACRSIFHTV